MRRLVAVGVLLTAGFVSGCSSVHHSSKEEGKDSTTPAIAQVVPGYSGGCKEGFTVWTQNQFSAADGGYGTLVRSALGATGQHVGLSGNNKLTVVGWFDSGEPLYTDNPAGIRGEVWYYIPQLPNGGAGWVPDAGVRAVMTTPAPGNLDSKYDQATQAAPKPNECKLTR